MKKIIYLSIAMLISTIVYSQEKAIEVKNSIQKSNSDSISLSDQKIIKAEVFSGSQKINKLQDTNIPSYESAENAKTRDGARLKEGILFYDKSRESLCIQEAQGFKCFENEKEIVDIPVKKQVAEVIEIEKPLIAKVNSGPIDKITPLITMQKAYIKSSNADKNDLFSWSLAISADGNTLVVGATGESSNFKSVSVDGFGETSNESENSGAVYVFARKNSAWVQSAYIKASNADRNDRFGSSVSISGNGNILAIGAKNEDSDFKGISTDGLGENINAGKFDEINYNSGAVYVFERTDSTVWTQSAYIKPSNTSEDSGFGTSVSLSSDGLSLAVGADFENTNTTGINKFKDIDPSVFSHSGAAYTFSNKNGIWEQNAFIKPSNPNRDDMFGGVVSISGNGEILAVSAVGEDSKAKGINNKVIGQNNNDLSNSGAVYLFSLLDNNWKQNAYIKASNAGSGNEFGRSLAISSDGKVLAVGSSGEGSSITGVLNAMNIVGDNNASRSGAVYVFRQNDNEKWKQEAFIKASNADAGDKFGTSVALSENGNTLLVGAVHEDSNAKGVNSTNRGNNYYTSGSGAAYIFKHNKDNIWSENDYLKASNRTPYDYFGQTVALSATGNEIVVGTESEKSSAKRVFMNGDAGKKLKNLIFSGAVYLFEAPKETKEEIIQ